MVVPNWHHLGIWLWLIRLNPDPLSLRKPMPNLREVKVTPEDEQDAQHELLTKGALEDWTSLVQDANAGRV